MTPIRPENRDRYPANWKAISRRIRFERAGGRCECKGECGHEHAGETMSLTVERGALDGLAYKATVVHDPAGARCTASHGAPHPVTGSRVVLTTAHLDHTPEHCGDGNLRAMCQRCHLAYDREHHAAERRRRS